MTTASASSSKEPTKGGQKGELKQAEAIFTKVAELDQADGWVNLARVYQREGRIPDALAALEKAASHKEPAAPWVINWLTGQINASNGLLDEAIASFESVLATKIPERKIRLQHSIIEVINELGAALYARRASSCRSTSPERRDYLKKAIAAYRRTLADRFRRRRRPLGSGPGLRRSGLGQASCRWRQPLSRGDGDAKPQSPPTPTRS